MVCGLAGYPAGMTVLLPIAIAVVILSVTYFFTEQQRQHLRAVWRRVASERGLRFTEGSLFVPTSMVGDIDDMHIHVDIHSRKQGKSSVPYTRVQVVPPQQVPDGLRLTPEGLGSALVKAVGGQDIQVGEAALDSRTRIQGDNPADVQALFADARLQSELLGLFSTSRFNHFGGGAVVLEKRGRVTDDIGRLMEQALSIARQLSEARMRPWNDLVRRHPDLALSTPDRAHIALAGQTADGLHVQAAARLDAGRTRLTVAVPADLPPGLVIAAGDRPGGVRLGDPVLDGMVSVSGAPAEVLRPLLLDDELRGELLAVVHAFPGSRVSGNSVVLNLPVASTLELADRLEDACRLARALARRVEAATSSPQAQRFMQPQRG